VRFILLFLIIPVLVVSGCNSDHLDYLYNIESDANNIGKIKKIDQSNSKILIEEVVAPETENTIELIWYFINSETVLEDKNGHNIKLKDLKIGQIVEAWNHGYILYSNPGQTDAVKIISH
jgi:hypothetical protein